MDIQEKAAQIVATAQIYCKALQAPPEWGTLSF